MSGRAIRGRASGPIGAVMILAALALGALPAAAECGNAAPPPSLSVFGTQMADLEERTVDPGELESLATSDALDVLPVLRRVHPLMVVISPLVADVSVDAAEPVAERLGGGFCPAPRSVRVRIGFGVRLAYVADAASAEACVRRVLLEHEERHARLDDELLAGFIKVTEGPFGMALARLKRVPAPTAEAATGGFATGVRRLVGEAARELALRRREIHTALDGPEEMERLRSACGARVRQFEELLDRSRGT
jgi:hypothetical protein